MPEVKLESGEELETSEATVQLLCFVNQVSIVCPVPKGFWGRVKREPGNEVIILVKHLCVEFIFCMPMNDVHTDEINH